MQSATYTIRHLDIAHTLLAKYPNELGKRFISGSGKIYSYDGRDVIIQLSSDIMKEMFAKEIPGNWDTIQNLFANLTRASDDIAITASAADYPAVLFALWASESLSATTLHLIKPYKDYTIVLKQENIDTFAAFCSKNEYNLEIKYNALQIS